LDDIGTINILPCLISKDSNELDDKLIDIDQVYRFEKVGHMFLNRNINLHDKLTTQEMHDSFQEFVVSGEVGKEDVPNMNTIKNWINSYLAEFKEQVIQKKKKLANK
ncbi:231_t:CDS:2, partial [Dentiscutata heterogama]